jgi:hypothetical protein
MKTTLKENDALRMLASSSKLSITELEKRILDKMESEKLLTGNVEDIGLSILKIMNLNGYDAKDAINILFPEQRRNEEIIQLLDSVLIWGDAKNNPCPKCGCQVEHEPHVYESHIWEVWHCTNCNFSTSNEPDWDGMKGGKDYDRY